MIIIKISVSFAVTYNVEDCTLITKFKLGFL